jgi:hypothetical protein
MLTYPDERILTYPDVCYDTGGKADAGFEGMSQDAGASCDMSTCRSSADNARVIYDLYSVMVAFFAFFFCTCRIHVLIGY